MHSLALIITVVVAIFIVAYLAWWPFRVAVHRLLGAEIVVVNLTAGGRIVTIRQGNTLLYKGRALRLLPGGAVADAAMTKVGEVAA